MNRGLVVRRCGGREIDPGAVINESWKSQRAYLNMTNPPEKMQLSANVRALPKPFSKGKKSAGEFADLLFNPPREIVLATLRDRDVRLGHYGGLADFPAIVFRGDGENLFMVLSTEGHLSTNYYLQAPLKSGSGVSYTLVLPESIVLRDVGGGEMAKWDGWNGRLELDRTMESPKGQIMFFKVDDETPTVGTGHYHGEKDLPEKSILLIEAVLEKAFAPLQKWFAERKLPAPWSVL